MVFRAASMMFASQASTTIILFLRNIIVARLVSVEDFGVASTFAILFALVETATNVGMSKMIVQDREGDEKRFADSLHSVQLIRGVLSAGLMVLLAQVYANFMNTPDLAWAYQILAIVPLARGVLHLDIYRVQRRMQFLPFAVSMVGSPILGLVAVLVVWLITPDWQVMLWSIVVQQVSAVVLSHFVAERRFGLAWDTVHVKRSLSFGIPLLLNGIVMFAILNGDRMLIGNQLGMTVLGWYSAAFMLANTPTTVVTNTASSIFLPKLSGQQADRERFDRLSLLAIEINLLIGLAVAVGLALAGPILLIGLFGAKYAPALDILVLLGLVQAIRITRTAPNTIAMAQGHTMNPLYANLVRVLALPAAYVCLVMGYDIYSVVVVALIAELGSLALGLWLVRSKLGVPVRKSLPAVAAVLAGLALIWVDLAWTPPGVNLLDNLHLFQLLLMGLPFAALAVMPEIVAGLRGLLAQRRGQSA